MKKALIISGTSSIGKEIIRLLNKDNISIVATGRNEKKLEELKNEFNNIVTFSLDITNNPIEVLDKNKEIFYDVDFILICSGYGELNYELESEIEMNTIKVNVDGCTEILLYFMNLFKVNKKGHIAIITSIGGAMANGIAPAYNASKAFLSNYIKGLQLHIKLINSPIKITDIKPGLVDTPMAKGSKLIGVMPAEKVAKQIYSKLNKKPKTIVVTKRWKIIYYILKLVN